MSKILIVATSRKTRGGITSVIKAHEKGKQWADFNCYWIQTHRDGSSICKLYYFITSLINFCVRVPFYDIVHVHFSLRRSANRKKIFVTIANLFEKKVISHLHCGSQIDDIWNSTYDYIFKKSDVNLMLSESLKQKVKSYIGDNYDCRICYNPCTAEPQRIEYQRVQNILFAGTLYEEKGYLDLIKAFAIIANKYSDWRLVFAGNGEIERGVTLAKELKIESQVDFLGWVDGSGKDKAFKEASIFCLPSFAEGFPMAVLDAWAYGLPVITTPVGGIPDVAIDGENMLLFNPRDIMLLSTQLERMILDESLRQKVASASSDFATHQFNINTINQLLYDLYNELSVTKN